MKFIKLLLIVIFLTASQLAYNQAETSFDFEFDDRCIVNDLMNNPYEFAWAGGLNSAQFCELDLDLDGISDLILFDKTGNKLLFFVAKYENSSLKYVFAPQYFKSFSELQIVNWMITADYDMDGKMDIFTYTRGGIKVYRNVSDTELKFKQVTSPFIKSYYNQLHTNILATYVDYPAIADIDGDGDLDILVFSALGAFVEYHKNYSMETYGHADSLLFYRESDCWGMFSESDESNNIMLDTCPDSKHINEFIAKNERHTGSTFLLFDADGDGLLDLLLGDVDYPQPCLLYNKGTSEEARITNYTFNYPAINPINLFSFPVMNYLDIDKDGKKDLLVSPFDPAHNKIDNTGSVWFYRNDGENNSPNFVLESKSFLQDKMIDLGTGAYPLFFDFDNDGDLDLFVGNWGYCDECKHDAYMNVSCSYTSQIAFFENIGNNISPKYVLITNDFASLSTHNLLGLYPAFFDFDDDGDYDLICGNSSGALVLFENQGNNFTLNSYNWLNQSITNTSYSAPSFFDFNKDGYADIVIGNENGRISYYQNDGNNQFLLMTDFFGEIDVVDTLASLSGYSTPCAYSFNDTTYLCVGSESGKMFCYYDIDNNLSGKFKEKIMRIDNLGARTAPALANLNDNSFPEMILGNFAGGLTYYNGIKSSPYAINDFAKQNIKIYPNPGTDFVIIDIDEDYDLKIFDISGRVVQSKHIIKGINKILLDDLQSSSVFVLRFSNKSGVQSFKWIKK